MGEATPGPHPTPQRGKAPAVTRTAGSGRFLIPMPGDYGQPFQISQKGCKWQFPELQGLKFLFYFLLKFTLCLLIRVLAGWGPLPVIHWAPT